MRLTVPNAASTSSDDRLVTRWPAGNAVAQVTAVRGPKCTPLMQSPETARCANWCRVLTIKAALDSADYVEKLQDNYWPILPSCRGRGANALRPLERFVLLTPQLGERASLVDIHHVEGDRLAWFGRLVQPGASRHT